MVKFNLLQPENMTADVIRYQDTHGANTFFPLNGLNGICNLNKNNPTISAVQLSFVKLYLRSVHRIKAG